MRLPSTKPLAVALLGALLGVSLVACTPAERVRSDVARIKKLLADTHLKLN